MNSDTEISSIVHRIGEPFLVGADVRLIENNFALVVEAHANIQVSQGEHSYLYTTLQKRGYTYPKIEEPVDNADVNTETNIDEPPSVARNIQQFIENVMKRDAEKASDVCDYSRLINTAYGLEILDPNGDISSIKQLSFGRSNNTTFNFVKLGNVWFDPIFNLEVAPLYIFLSPYSNHSFVLDSKSDTTLKAKIYHVLFSDEIIQRSYEENYDIVYKGNIIHYGGGQIHLYPDQESNDFNDQPHDINPINIIRKQ